MTRNQQFAVLFSALLLAQAQEAQAVFVDRAADNVGSQSIQGGGFTDTFAQIDSAFRFVSFSGGSIFGGEGSGGTFTLYVEYSGGGEEALTSFFLSGNSNVALSTLGNFPFTQGNVVGLRFVDDTSNQLGPLASVSMSSVTYRFEAADPPTGVPEPFSAALLGTGLLGLAWARRLRS